MAIVNIARGPWAIDTTTITTVNRLANGNVQVITTVGGTPFVYELTLAEATQINAAIASTAGFIPQIPPALPNQPFAGSVFPSSRVLNCGVQSVDDRLVVLAWGLATTDAGIVADIGADALYADGSLYLSCVGTGGVMFQKANDVWVPQSASGAAQQYIALLTQSGGAAPVATVLRNTTGTTITPARSSAGLYTLTSGGTPFTASKTQIYLGGEVQNQPATTFNQYGAVLTSTSVITIQSSLVTLNAGPPPTGVATDGLLTGKSIAVSIYP